MDYGSLIALGLAMVAILGGQAIDGGNISLFLQPAAFMIVFLGTLAAVLLQNPASVFIQGIKMGRWAFRPPGSTALLGATSPDEDCDCDAYGLSSRSVGGQGVGRVAYRAHNQGTVRPQVLRP